MAGRGGWFDSESGSLIGIIIAGGLAIGTAVGLAYKAGTDVSERVLRQHRRDKREFDKTVRCERKEKKKEANRNRLFRWWEKRHSDSNEDE